MGRVVECPVCGYSYWSGVVIEKAPIGKTFQELVAKYQEALLTRNWSEGPFSGAAFRRKKRSTL